MTTAEGWRDEQGVKTCALGRVGGGRLWREEGPGLLTWPFGNGSLFGSFSSLDTAIAATDPRTRLATGFFPAPVCAGYFGSPKDQGILLGTPEQRDAGDWREGRRFRGSGRESLPPGREGSPHRRFGDTPKGFLLLDPLPPRSVPRQADRRGSCRS